MTIREALQYGADVLWAVPDPRIDAELLLCDVLNMRRMTLALNAVQALTDEQERRYRELLSIRLTRKPLQYILGTQSFFGCELRVDARALIPRQETEILCELALQSLQGLQRPAVADLCTGSGAIAIVIKHSRPDAAVWATELSEAALALARQNARQNGADITFAQGDLLAPLAGRTFDCLVSNPPYIPSGEMDTLQPEVRCEPRMALDGGADGLTFYRRLAAEAPDYLNPKGKIFMEFGDGQAQDVQAIFDAAQRFGSLRVHRDLYGQPRILEAALGFA
ncbi:MAG TPA: peptide chain release factor N(5)-glutamine methyltransferase [Candidatus Limiplasma sp.]|nr:peptide chain release factor N(5)-glutamine methyltransferase [Candidatus Limiplasma sp.]